MAFNGCLDRCDSQLVAGWAMHPHRPDQKSTIDIYAGERFLGRCIADQYRRDLDEAGLLGGCFSFNFAPPADLADSDIPAIRAFIRGSGYMFACGVPEPMLDVEIADIYRLHDAADGAPARRFRKAILHIGCEKTGSTTLQNFLHLNRAQFARAGYFIPLSLAPAPGAPGINHCYLPTLAMDDHGFGDDLRKAACISCPATLLAYRRDVFTRFREEAAHAPADADTLILSSEHCHSRLSSLQSIRHLKRFLDLFCDDIRIVVYLRPQHEVARSRYGMFLLSGIWNIEMFPPLAPPPGYDRIINTPPGYFDYANLLDRWAQVFGEAAIEPRLFEPAALRNGDIIDDFITGLGLPHGGLVKPPARNNNVSAAAQAFLVNWHASGDAASLCPETRQAFSELLRARCPGTGLLPSRHVARAFFEQFAASNEALRQRWFPHRHSLFACDFSAYPEEQALPPNQDIAIFQDMLDETRRCSGRRAVLP